MKGVSPFISFSLTFLLAIVIIGVVLTTLNPFFEKARVSAIIDEAMNNLYAIDKAVKEVASEGIGSQRVVDLKVSGGVYRVDNRTGSLEYTLKTSKAPFEYGITKQYGNIRLYSGGTAKVYLENNDTVVLENNLLKIGMRANPYKQNWTGIKWNYGCWKYYNGSNFTNMFDHLVLYLPFEAGDGNVAYDYSGYGNNGTIRYLEGWVKGKYGNGLEFNGTHGCVVVPFPKLPYDKTIMAWVNREPNSRATIFTIDDADWGYRGYAFRIDSNGKLVFRVENGTKGENIYSSISIPPNTWNFVTAVYNSTQKTVTFYANGVKDGPYSFTMPNTWNISQFNGAIAGEDCIGNEVGLNGIIDEVRVYNKALSPEEIRWLYNHEKWKYQTDFLQVGFDENFVNVSDYNGNTLEVIHIPSIKIDGKPLSEYFSMKNLIIYYYDWEKNKWMKFGCNNITFEHLPELGYDWPTIDNTTGEFIDPRYKQENVLLYSWVNGNDSLNITFFVTAHDPFIRMKIDKSIGQTSTTTSGSGSSY